jgi:hypothetical protein
MEKIQKSVVVTVTYHRQKTLELIGASLQIHWESAENVFLSLNMPIAAHTHTFAATSRQLLLLVLQPHLLTLVVVCLQDGLAAFPATGGNTATRSENSNRLQLYNNRMGTGSSFPTGKDSRILKLNTHFHLVPYSVPHNGYRSLEHSLCSDG